MLPSGFAFWRTGHPWFILTDPVPAAGRVVCVNLTTLDEECVDDECVLHREDYAWIQPNHPTAVAFSYAESYDVAKLERAFRAGYLKAANPALIPPATLAKVRAIAAQARELSDDLKALL